MDEEPAAGRGSRAGGGGKAGGTSAAGAVLLPRQAPPRAAPKQPPPPPLPPAPFLVAHGRYPVHFEEDWEAGIGGGLWSTGSALARYLAASCPRAAAGASSHRLLPAAREEGTADDPARVGSRRGGDPAVGGAPPQPYPPGRRHSCLRAIELGSGNGLLSACWLALWRRSIEEDENNGDDGDATEAAATQHCGPSPGSGEGDRPPPAAAGDGAADSPPPPRLAPRCRCQLVVTDTLEHLPLIRRTLDANRHLMSPAGGDGSGGGAASSPSPSSSSSLSPSIDVRVAEYRWGSGTGGAAATADGTGDCGAGAAAAAETTATTATDGGGGGGGGPSGGKFDVILGSDVAYRPDLYGPLVASLVELSHRSTVAYLGVTMADTRPDFFRLLTGSGFEYRRLDDRLLDPEYRGWAFGVFVVTVHSSAYPAA